MTPRHFLFMVCQSGAENALKNEVTRRHPTFRFSFSRPGFVTFATPEDMARDRKFQPNCTFTRTWGYSLGKVNGTDPQQLVAETWALLVSRFPKDVLSQFRHLHVWERDADVPGENGFEPGISVLADEMGELLLAARPDIGQEWPLVLNEDAAEGDRVLDCVLVEPGEWWVGWHRANRIETRWPGGVPEIDVPSDMVSRTFLKTAEALKWSEFRLTPIDQAIEIGSAPGGSCQALLLAGLDVVGVDPAEMDPLVVENPRFKHVRGKAKDLKRSVFSDARWLLADASVAPNYTLDTVEAIVTHEKVEVEGLILTMKLTSWELADEIPLFNKRIRGWGYDKVRSRQLAFNRQEFCIVASKDPKSLIDWKEAESQFGFRLPTAEENAMIDALRRNPAAVPEVEELESEITDEDADLELDDELADDELEDDEDDSEDDGDESTSATKSE